MIQLEVTYPSTELLAVGASVPIGQRGQVIVEGLNKMATNQKLGISWVIKDPDGITPVVGGEYEYSAWEYGSTGPDATHTFSGGYFLLNKAGTWRIGIGLFMNLDSPVQVASYDGDLCIAEAVVEAEFRDFGITSYDTVVAGEKIELTYGDTLKVNVSFDYRGPAGSATLYGAIGNSGFPGEELIDEGSFLKRLTGEQSIDLPQSLEFTPVEASVDIPITTEISAYTNYDLYVKLVEYRKEAGMPKVDNIIDILPEYELLEETIYPLAYIYEGPHEGGTFTFKSDPLTPASWITGRLAASYEDEVRKAGGKMLEMRVYVDKSPLLWTDWRIEVITVPPKTTAGMTTGIVWWAAAILIVLAIALIIVLTWAAKKFVGLFKRKVGLEDVKPAWGKETLIGTIQDSEEYWERTPTPVETLEGKSEGELRDYLDKIAEEEVPLGVSWLPWAIGAGVLAVGTVAVLAVKKKK